MTAGRFMTTEDKIGAILAAENFASIPSEAMPPSHRDNYYFVSYSHRDYKTVLPDILRLEALGVPLWYDREMHIGENWQEVAELYLSKFQCAGIIFYLTENSIASPACNREVEYTLSHNKHFLSVNLALPGRGPESGYAMLCEMERRGFVPPEGLKENFRRAFSDEILYLDAADTAENKAACITAIRREPLLKILPVRPGEGKAGSVMLAGCRDSGILAADLAGRFGTESAEDYRDGEITVVDDCAFTNCFGLQRVTVPDGLRRIGESAFRNCTALSSIDLSHAEKLQVGKSAFRGCTSLAAIDLSKADGIGDNAFDGCANLRQIGCLSGRIGSNAFADTQLSEVRYIEPSPVLSDRAFRGLKSLRRFDICGRFESDLGAEVFEGCESLVSAGPFTAPWHFEGGWKDSCKVGCYAFSRCRSLERISFSGAWSISEAARLFMGCSSLDEIVLNIDGVILPTSFAEDCTALKSVKCNDLFTVGERAFYGCSSLRHMDMERVGELGARAFAASGLEKAYLPGATEIGASAFAACTGLTEVNIGGNCRKIGDHAFYGCTALSVIRIASDEISVDAYTTFSGCDSLRTVYFRSMRVYYALRGQMDLLEVLYIGKDLPKSKEMDLSDFEETESDEWGYVRYARRGTEKPTEEETEEDPTAAETNEPCPDHPHYAEPQFREKYLGREVEIRHLRLRRPHRYFVEEAACRGDSVDHLVVSVHDGLRFRIDGSLIQEIRVTEAPRGELLRLDDPHELDGRACRLTASGAVHYAVVSHVDVVSVMGTPLPVVSEKAGGSLQYAVNCLWYDEDGTVKAASGLDVESIVVFDENFNAQKIIGK